MDAYYDKVLEYQGGAFFTSDRHYPDAKWHLTCGNSKPEGIADPPPPGDTLPAGAYLLSVLESGAGRVSCASEFETVRVPDLATKYAIHRADLTTSAARSELPAGRAPEAASRALAADEAFSAFGEQSDDASDDVIDAAGTLIHLLAGELITAID